MKKVHYFIEAILAYLFYYSLRMFSFDTASNIGGRIGKWIGPKLEVHKIAYNNIKNAMPELSKDEIQIILKDMWENLGRTVGEFSQLPRLTGDEFKKRVTIEGEEHFEKAKARGKGFIFFSGHFANWEIAPKTAAEIGYPLALVYRHSNNPMVDRLILKTRKGAHNGMFSKGKGAAKGILAHLKKGGHIGMLVDQKKSDGIPIKFFGRDVMTAQAAADFALKYGIPLIPAKVKRVNKTHFQTTIFPELEIEGKSTEQIMTEVNELFESWIRETPSQWLWVHKRWPEEDI